MAELALRTTEFKNQKTNYLAWRPVGSVIVALSEHQKRRKWLEIVCDLVAPYKRETYKAIPGWQALVDHWTPQLREMWLDIDRPNESFPLGPLLQDRPIAQKIWDDNVDSQLSSALGKEPRGDVDFTDTWLWSEHERKTTFIVSNFDETDEAHLETYGEKLNGLDAGNIVFYSKVKVDFKTDIPSLSPETIADIENPDVIVHPKLNVPISKILFNTPDIARITQ